MICCGQCPSTSKSCRMAFHIFVYRARSIHPHMQVSQTACSYYSQIIKGSFHKVQTSLQVYQSFSSLFETCVIKYHTSVLMPDLPLPLMNKSLAVTGFNVSLLYSFRLLDFPSCDVNKFWLAAEAVVPSNPSSFSDFLSHINYHVLILSTHCYFHA